MCNRLETLIKSGFMGMPRIMKTHVSPTSKINENPHSEQQDITRRDDEERVAYLHEKLDASSEADPRQS